MLRIRKAFDFLADKISPALLEEVKALVLPLPEENKMRISDHSSIKPDTSNKMYFVNQAQETPINLSQNSTPLTKPAENQLKKKKKPLITKVKTKFTDFTNLKNLQSRQKRRNHTEMFGEKLTEIVGNLNKSLELKKHRKKIVKSGVKNQIEQVEVTKNEMSAENKGDTSLSRSDIEMEPVFNDIAAGYEGNSPKRYEDYYSFDRIDNEFKVALFKC